MVSSSDATRMRMPSVRHGDPEVLSWGAPPHVIYGRTSRAVVEAGYDLPTASDLALLSGASAIARARLRHGGGAAPD